MINVLVVDDMTMLSHSLKFIIEQDKDIKVVGCAQNGIEALNLCEDLSPDVILMDIVMPVCDGVEGTKMIKMKYPHIKVIILTTFEDDNNISNALKNGADGYILKDVNPNALRLAIKSVREGMPIVHQKVFDSVVKQIKANPDVQIQSPSTPESHENSYLNSETKLEIDLTHKELFIIKSIVLGKSNKDIASELGLSEGRVKNIISEILYKMNFQDRVQLAVFAVRSNLV